MLRAASAWSLATTRQGALLRVAALGVAAVPVRSGAVARSADWPVFRPPVEAPISDGFRAPEHPYGPGNRGLEYDTEPSEPVRAAADGIVTFAGPVAGELYVTVDHGGGVLSSYSYLARISVSEGARVTQGQVVGTTGERMHFGVRVNSTYVDPNEFIGVRQVKVRLVPVD